MYLKSVTLKGFKSFADPTTIELEPGVTVVVGPNGSGKSNVVDAVAWALGAQGPRVVRSAKMDDVIFAGSAKRPALGRAEVSIVIDNSSRRLPIEFSEVTVTRTLFRSGESEYAINAVPCRLLDVQELFSDTGVGRQQHVIVGQGQLDTILAARPEDRRTVIEEAAGVLKYRRRRERAERRLLSSEESITRLEDVSHEVRRQVRPLERQAAAAVRHEELSVELRSLARYVTGRELGELDNALALTLEELASLDAATANARATTRSIDSALLAMEALTRSDDASSLAEAIAGLNRLSERAKGLLSVIAERRRSSVQLALALDEAPIAALEASLARVESELAETSATSAALEQSAGELSFDDARLRADQADFGREDDRDGVALEAGVAIAQAEIVAAETLHSERERRVAATAARLSSVSARRAELSARLETHRDAIEKLAGELVGAEDEKERATARAAEARQGEEASALSRRSADDERAAAAARVEVLEAALDEARARAGLDRLAGAEGLLGTVLDVVEVESGVERAFEAAVEGALDSVVIAGLDAARAALRDLKAHGHSGSILPATTDEEKAPLPRALVGGERLIDAVRGATPAVDALVARLIGGVVLCRGGFDEALDLARRDPRSTVVTLDGDRFSPRGWRLGAGGAGASASALVLAREALERATAHANHAKGVAEAAVLRSREAGELAQGARIAAGEIRAELARQRSSVEVLGREADASEEEERQAQREREEIVQGVESANETLADARRQFATLQSELDATKERRALRDAERSALEQRAARLAARRRELEVSEGAIAERRRLLLDRQRELTDDLATRREAESARTDADGDGLERWGLERASKRLAALDLRLEEESARLSGRVRERALVARTRVEEVARLRQERERAEETVDTLRERRQVLELAQVEHRVRREAVVERLGRELGLSPHEALELPVPTLADGTEPERRLAVLEHELASLGPINPLARAELAELTERNTFLDSQLEDVRNARRELRHVIDAIDKEIVEVFAGAFADVARHFENLIETLFPGGSGALSLTAPDDLLSTGVEIEARPPGRNVRRLSLLSGGERALVALAFLFAVFRSRPSPFYLMDEVEAALDDVNLQRFLDLLEQFRAEAQLIVVSHQKKTMEIADALYGITLQPGGSSKAVSERIRRTGPSERPSDVVTAEHS